MNAKHFHPNFEIIPENWQTDLEKAQKLLPRYKILPILIPQQIIYVRPFLTADIYADGMITDDGVK